MARILTICFLLFSLQCAFAQITGKVVDPNGGALPFTNVLLLNALDSSFVQGTLTDDDGTFTFNKPDTGNYLLNLRSIGYQSWYSAPFSITEQQPSKAFGTLNLLEQAVMLNELEVRAQKMPIQQLPGGMVLNVQSSIMTKGSSALTVLERSPGVFIDRQNGNISLNGQSGVMIMINGKLQRVSAAQIITMLEGVSANNIEKIELLTTPPAKYEAEGSAGLINIVFSKPEDLGTNGSISLSAGYGWKAKAGTSLDLNHHSEHTNIFGSYAYNYDKTYSDWRAQGTELIPVLGGNLDFDVSNTTNRLLSNHNITLGLERTFNKTTLGTNISYQSSLSDFSISNLTDYSIHPDSFLHIIIGIDGKNGWNNLNSNAFLEKTLGDKSVLHIDADYLFYQNDNPTNAQSNFFNRNGQPIYPDGAIYANRNRGTSTTDLHLGVLKVDFEKTWPSEIKLEAGIKNTYAQTSNVGILQRLEQAEWVSDDRNQTTLETSEYIGAAYGSVYLPINQTTNLTLGARYAYWNRQFDGPTPDRTFGKLFPTIFFSKQFTENHHLRLSYAKRISRPSYNDLASYLSYNDPISVFTGNPLLQPTISNVVKIGYQFKAYNFSLQFQRDENPIVRYQLTNNAEEDLVIIAPQNVDFQNSITLQVDLPWEINNWWSLNLGANPSWRQFKISHTAKPTQKEYLTFNIYGSQTFRLPFDFSLEISGWYTGPFYEGSKRFDGFGVLNGGLKKQLKDNKGSFQLTVTDLLKSMEIDSYFGRLTEEAFSVESKVRYHAESGKSRIIQLTYFRSFGNNQNASKRRKKSGSEEEKARIRRE